MPYMTCVLKSFRSKALRLFAERDDASKLSEQNPARIRRILLALDAATSPEQMNLPGFKFHTLKGSDKGRFSVWTSGNYRITFGWIDKDATEIDLEDYH